MKPTISEMNSTLSMAHSGLASQKGGLMNWEMRQKPPETTQRDTRVDKKENISER